jgi:hypothetical protein
MNTTSYVCRSCSAPTLTTILDLGVTPLANALLTDAMRSQPEAVYPLKLVFCEHCALAQITETVPPAELFSEYLYLSSFSDTMLRHAQAISEHLIAERALGPHSLVAEIASNDGYLLQYYHQRDIPVLGIEPATNIAVIAERERGVRTLNEFFGLELAQHLRNRN